MAISRPFLLALLGAALLGATFFAVQNARDDSDGDAAAPAAQQSAPEQQAAAPAEPAAPSITADEALAAAVAPDKLFKSGFSLTLSARGGGETGTLEISGAFERGAANDLPTVEVSVEGSAPGERFEGGFVAVDDAAYFTQGEKAWRVPEQVWTPLVEATASGQGPSLQNLPVQLEPQRWVTGAKVEGTETVDGVETTHVSGSVDPMRVLRDIDRSFPSVELPNRAEIARGVKSAEVDAWVGTEDRIVRRLAVEVGAVIEGERGTLGLDLRLTDVNQPQQIEAPADLTAGAPGGALGRFAETFVAGVSSADGSPAVSLAALTSPNPQRAARAVAEHKRVVVLFQNPEGLDDRAMRRNMDALERRTDALVLVDHVDAVDRYGKMVEDLGVSQTPSVVLIDRTGDARLIEGYVDTDTLAQAVADAR
jgi:hypothetical protein